MLYLTVTTPASGTFEVVAAVGQERISGLFAYTLELGADDLDVDYTTLLGQPVTLTIEHEDATKIYRNGIVVRLTQRLDEAGRIIYIMELAPWAWALTLGTDCRIFQNKTTPQIIEQVFGDCGRTDFRNSLSGTYSPREYCVQYNETHFAFVSRLMEDEGIFYFFEHEDGKHTMVLADDADAFQDCPGLSAAVKYLRFGTDWSEYDGVDACLLEEQVVSSGYQTSDYNFETPDTDLLVTVQGSSTAGGGGTTIYEYAGVHMTKDVGEARSKLRIEEAEVPLKSIKGRANVRNFLAGGKFTLKEHYRADANTSYVLRGLNFRVVQDRYATEFEAFPASATFRPPRVTPRPRVHGYQTAKVVGKSGEEIWTDKYGRVKVSFPWDTRSTDDENSSCWIRVAQPWAGKAWGTLSIPRIGTEAIISFLDGDPDRPLITGTVFNAVQTVPYTLPDESTKTTIKTNSSKGGGGFNEIRFEDKKGSEQIFIHGEKDLDQYIKNDAREHYGNEHHLTIVKNSYEKVSGERHTTVVKDELVKIDGGRSTTIAKDDTAKIDGARNATIAKDDAAKVGGAYNLDVTGDHSQKSGGTLSMNAAMNIYEKSGMSHGVEAGQEIHLKGGMNVVIEAGMTVTLKAGGGFIVVGPAGVTISGTPVMINSGGSAGAGGGCSPKDPAAPGDPTAPTDPTDAAEI